ncbi:receptor-like protein kinase 2 [Prunus dulcis]|uniref:Receptor-like protein kinase 2 n=1 Tax=Prunus dulcis TaxID=3755 RepID=A0A4Y1R7Y1_PRUDU|nr:receptor-like protein kinase 2 [Prunus dulcis]
MNCPISKRNPESLSEIQIGKQGYKKNSSQRKRQRNLAPSPSPTATKVAELQTGASETKRPT